MKLEIWSDIACPWCYVGKRRLETALERFEHRDEVDISWRSFELDVAAPAVREDDHATHLAHKYGRSLEQSRAMLASMTETAAAEGLDFRFDRSRGANTFDAHRLVHLGAEHGLQDAVKERVLRAYFTDGDLVSDHATLARLGADAGLDAGAVAEMLAGDRFADAVRADERLASHIGISGVPFFVADRALGLSGAQSPEVLLEFLEQAWDRRPQPV